MSRENPNPNQIIRKDGRGCFVEALKSSFAIGKVLFKFVNYDNSKQKGNKITSSIDIYMDFEKFNQIYYDLMVGKKLISEATSEKARAAQATQQTGKKVWANQIMLTQGGTSAASLNRKGKARPDGKSEARVLKFFAGDKLPFMFQAEKGMGETSQTGLIIPKYGTKPDAKVSIGMTGEDMKEFFTTVHMHVQAYIAAEYTYEKMKVVENKIDTLTTLVSKIADSMGIPSAEIIRQCEEQIKQAQQAQYSNHNNQEPQANYNYQDQSYYNQPPQPDYNYAAQPMEPPYIENQLPQPQYEAQPPFFPEDFYPNQ